MITEKIKKKLSFSPLLAALFAIVLFASCEPDDTSQMPSGVEAPVLDRVSLVNKDSTTTVGLRSNMYAIYGKNLSTTQRITFNDTEAYFNPTLVTDTNILVAVPADAPYFGGSDKLVVETTAGSASLDFSVAQPAPDIDSFSPLAAGAGDIVTIVGSVFEGVESVRFGDVEAEIVSATATEIQVRVPEGIVQSYIFVETAGGVTQSAQAFGFKFVIYDDALAAFMETARLAPEHVDVHYQAGLLYEQKGDIDNAVNQYERTIELDQSNVDPFLRLGAIYLKRGDKENVIRTYEPALVMEPNHPQARYDLAVIFEEREENEKAIKHFELANQSNATRYDWHFRYARLLDRHVATLEDYNQYAAMAVEEYTRAAALNPDYADTYFYRGLITRRYKQIGNTLYRYSQIAEDFKQVIELQPRNANAHYYLGLTYADLDRRRKAKEIFQKTLRVKSQYRGANLQIGLIAEWEQKYKEAIGHYEAEVAIDPKSAKSYQHLADLYNTHVMDFGRAKVAFQKALELEPNHLPTLLNYGNTLYNLDKLGAATEQFELALQLEPGDLTANYNLALIYEQTEKKQQAIDRWTRFLKLNPPAEWRWEAEQHLQQLQP